MQETQTRIQSLGGGDPLEEGMAPHSSIAWRIPWTEEPGRLQSLGLQNIGQDWAATTLTFSSFLGLPPPPHLIPLGCYSTKLGSLCYVSASY